MYFNQFGERAYLDKVHSVLNMINKKPNPIYDLLFDLNPSHILTTNYDQLLETCAYENQHPYSVVNKDTALPTAEYEQRIVKVHGDFLDGGANIVLKEDDYLSYPRNYPLIKSFIESLFASSVVLFVGYGYQDDNLKQIIDQVQVYLGGKSHKAFLIKPDESNKIELDYFNKKNVQVISFQNEMLDYLKPENNHHYQDLNIDSRELRGRGLKLFKCLNFISRFDPSTYRLSLNDIIERCIISIESINQELPYLSSFHLRNL